MEFYAMRFTYAGDWTSAGFLWGEGMKIRVSRWGVVPSVMLMATMLGACITSARSDNLSTFADAGIAYGNSVSALSEYVEAQHVDHSSRNILAQYDSVLAIKAQCSANETPLLDDCEGEPDKSIKDLQEHLAAQDQEIAQTNQLNADVRAQSRLLSEYFRGLKLLAKYDSAAAGQDAFGGLAGAINTLTESISKNKLLSDSKVDAAGQIGGLVADAYKGKVLGDVLKRDKEVIGNALAWQGEVLKFYASTARSFTKSERRSAYAEKVEKPLRALTISDRKAWIASRRDHLVYSNEIALLQKASEDARKMQELWAELLLGADDPELAIEVLDRSSRLNEAIRKLAE
ncbi:hypothetical protein ACQKH5_13180 [Hyphomonas sp. NPDC076900]|uniref:hypothetical protein n=1 Tax=unclassified Hyphomonas TaxID=2630699 RepID=UPI003D074107